MGKAHDLIRETHSLARQILLLQRKYDGNIAKLQDFFDAKNIKEIEVESENPATGITDLLVAKKQERITINYDLDKLKEALPKEIINEITTKSYEVTDMQHLKTMLRDAGASAAEFKQCIHTDEKLNREAIKRLYSIGDISKKNLEGCYTATITKKINIIEKGEKD